MLNVLWVFLLAGGLVYGALTGQPQLAAQAAMDGATGAVSLVISLLGITMLYMGLMEIATQSGLAKKVSSVVAVLIKPLFPSLKKQEPAMQAICMNLSANALGMGNAATPLGLAAMEELQKKNKEKKRATNEMVALIVPCSAGSLANDGGSLQLCGVGVHAGHCGVWHGQKGGLCQCLHPGRGKGVPCIFACAAYHALHAQRHRCG